MLETFPSCEAMLDLSPWMMVFMAESVLVSPCAIRLMSSTVAVILARVFSCLKWIRYGSE